MFKKKKLTLNEILNLSATIGNFNKSAEEQGVDAKLGYKMARFLMKLEKPIEAYEKQRQALLKKYGEQKDGELVVKDGMITLKDSEKYNKELQELLKTSEQVEILSEKVKIAEFGDLKLKQSFFLGFADYLED